MPFPQLSTGLGPSGPGLVGASGTITAAGLVCQLRTPRARKWAVLLDGSSLGTANLLVSYQVYNSSTGLWISPASFIFYGFTITNPATVTFGSANYVVFEGPFEGLGLTVASFGTSTGSFNGTVYAL